MNLRDVERARQWALVLCDHIEALEWATAKNSIEMTLTSAAFIASKARSMISALDQAPTVLGEVLERMEEKGGRFTVGERNWRFNYSCG